MSTIGLLGYISTGATGISGSAVYLSNPEKHDSITAIPYNDSKLPAAVLTCRSDKSDEHKLLFLVRSANRARYHGRKLEFWSHRDEAVVKWGVEGEQLNCKLDAGNSGGI
jgi:hypothetical protein